MVAIGAPVAFTHLWLIPRLLRFRRENPGCALRVVSRDDRVELGSGEVNLLFRFGTGPFPDGETVASVKDTVFPVCSPD